MDEHQNFLPQAYPMYASEDEQYLVYQPQMPPYNVHPGPPPRGCNALVFISAGIEDLIRLPAALLFHCTPRLQANCPTTTYSKPYSINVP